MDSNELLNAMYANIFPGSSYSASLHLLKARSRVKFNGFKPWKGPCIYRTATLEPSSMIMGSYYSVTGRLDEESCN